MANMLFCGNRYEMGCFGNGLEALPLQFNVGVSCVCESNHARQPNGCTTKKRREGSCHLAPAVGGPSLPRRAAAPLVHHVARAPSPDEALSLTVAPYAGCISGIDGRPCQNTC